MGSDKECLKISDQLVKGLLQSKKKKTKATSATYNNEMRIESTAFGCQENNK